MDLLIQGQDERAQHLEQALSAQDGWTVTRDPEASAQTIVYVPGAEDPHRLPPQSTVCETLFQQWRKRGLRRLVILSSSEVYPARHSHPGMVAEVCPAVRDDHISQRWLAMERAAEKVFANTEVKLTILRHAPVILPGSSDFFSRLLSGFVSITVAGHNPSIQFLDPADLTGAVTTALQSDETGLFNIAPSGVIPLHKALKSAGVMRLPIPWLFLFLWAKLFARTGWTASVERRSRIRYSFTVSAQKAQDVLSFKANRDSDQAICQFADKQPKQDAAKHDDFGWDPAYVDTAVKYQLRFAHNMYWRVEYEGLEHIPKSGRGMLVGVHRGFMPFDGTMILYAVKGAVKRYTRFLIHPCLIKQPFLCDFITRLGGLVATRENAARVLDQDELLGVFPEGINGAYTYYKDAYKLGNFGRDEYVRMALRSGAPIIPFVTVGSAEIYPIVGRIDIGWWRRISEWPFIPVTTPIPMPSKWHTQILPPIPIGERYPPEAADDPQIVAAIGSEIKQQMQQALLQLKSRRKHLFIGSIFKQPAPEKTSSLFTTT